MDNSSLAAQAVAAGPLSVAPPSFNGAGWLVVVNLAFFTFAFFIFAMLAAKWIGDLWRNRRRDARRHPVTVFRMIGIGLAISGTIRFGIGAATLWGWNPLDPEGTARLLNMQRFFDPIAATLGMMAIGTMFLAERGMVEQLRRQPFPIAFWASMPMLRRPLILAALCLVAAIGVVSTR